MCGAAMAVQHIDLRSAAYARIADCRQLLPSIVLRALIFSTIWQMLPVEQHARASRVPETVEDASASLAGSCAAAATGLRCQSRSSAC